jgi:hypothetical protein
MLGALSLNTVKVSAPVSPVVKIDPGSITEPYKGIGETFTVTVYTDYSGGNISSYEFTLTFNPVVLNITGVSNGGLIVNNSITSAVFKLGTWDNEEGKLSLTSAFFSFYAPPADVTNGPGILATVSFIVVGWGDSDLTLGPETKLIGVKYLTGEKFNIIDDNTPDVGHILHGYFANTFPIHDVAVTSVSPSSSLVYSGQPVTVTVNVANQGNVTEEFDVTAYYGTVPIDTKTVTLAGATSQLLIFNWNTTPARGNLTVSAEASVVGTTVVPETDLNDNQLDDGIVEVKPPIIAVEPREIYNFTIEEGEYIVINITITDAYDLYKAIFNVTWNGEYLKFFSITQGDFLEGVTTAFNYVATPHNETKTMGVFVNYTRTGAVPGVTGSGLLATLTLEVFALGGTNLDLDPPPPWWTTEWKTMPIVKGGKFVNLIDVRAIKLALINYTAYPTWSVPLKIKYATSNVGFDTAVVNCSAYANDTLAVSENRVVGGKTAPEYPMYWNLAGMSPGNYTMKLDVSTPGDLKPLNDVLINGTVTLRIPGDIDGDWDVDPFDFSAFRVAYGSKGPPQVPTKDPNYDVWADFEWDGDVDPFDFSTFRVNYGTDLS